MSNRYNNNQFFTPHNKATLLDCSFIVDSANGNGLGIRSLKNSGRIQSVYMHTTATPAAGNPNPQAGVIVVNLQDNYNRYLAGSAGFVVPVSGSALTISSSAVLTIGHVYIITSLGNSATTDWSTIGVPANIVPAVGVSFIATATTAGGASTGTVMTPAAAGAGVFNIAVIGDPNQMNSNGAYVLGAGNGMQIISGCYADSASDVPVLAAPADNTVIGLLFYMNDTTSGV